MGWPNVSPMEKASELVQTTLDTNLATEVGLMQTEAADGLVLPAHEPVDLHEEVEEWRRCTVEAIALGILPSEINPTELANGRLTSNVHVDVAVTILRDADTTDANWNKIHARYAAAVLRVLAMRYHRLGDTTGLVLYCRPNGLSRTEVDPDQDPGGRLLQWTVVPFAVRLTEVL